MNFKDKVVLITGAGAGIGKAAAALFAESGAKVAINSFEVKHEKSCLAMLREKGADGIFLYGDVSKIEDTKRLVNETVKRFGRIDILVNVAGIVMPGRVDNTTEQQFASTMDVNVKGTFFVSQNAVLEMKKTGGGVIVNIASVAAVKGVKDRAAYSASKGAVLSLTKAMALDYIKENIRVNCVCPGTTYTPAIETKIQNAPDPEAMKDEFISRQPMGRLGKVEEIAQAILFACCDEAGYMTGSAINIDGGMTI